MLNMNSPIVQNLMQSGFNPYSPNSGYTPQYQEEQNIYYGNNPYITQQNVYYGYTPQQQQNIYGYNPYIQQSGYQQDILNNWENSYDPMPRVIINEARGINSQMIQPSVNNYNNSYYNNQAFNGYMNPVLMKNQFENNQIRQREEAIQQGKIWKTLLKGRAFEDYNLDIDEAVDKIESLYYYEPPKEEIPIKKKIIIDKNNHIAELESKLLYYRQNNIPIITANDIMRANICNYYNNINSIIGDVDNCDMVDYFSRVYPELKYRQLSQEADKFNKNLKNKYNNNEFNKIINEETKNKPDSYFAKIMESFAETGPRFETSNGLIVTADEMEVKLPERLLKNRQDLYYEQRKKFFNAVFNKEGTSNG